MKKRKTNKILKEVEIKNPFINQKIDVVYTESKPFIPIDAMPKWYQYKKKKEWKKNQDMLSKKEKVVLVKMEMNNGRFREFLVLEDAGSFIFNKNRYVFDLEQKYYIIDRDIWAYDFHESLSLPIRKKVVLTEDVDKFLSLVEEKSRKPIPPKIESNEIRKLVENSNLIDVESSLNPTTLKHFTDSEVIKQVLQGAMLGKIFKVMFVLIIIIGIVVLLMFFLDLYHSGIFEKISEQLK